MMQDTSIAPGTITERDEIPRAILISGASGFLGGLVVVRALRSSGARLILPLRDPEQETAVVDTIAAELAADGRSLSSEDRERLVFVSLPPPARMSELVPVLRAHGVVDILHCAGCLSYFNVQKLQEGNIELTQALVDLGVAVGVRRFVFLSTAYSSGFTSDLIREALHEEPGEDPTDYTRTKREAEMIVARSGLPFVIVRPSIVIGDSRDGRYGGKPYGVYQLWTAGVRYLAGVFPKVLHVVAAEEPINFLHQDAFVNGFWAAYRTLPDGAVMHLVSRDTALPTMRELWTLWMERHGGPHEIHFYDRLADVPVDGLDENLRLWLDFTAVNSEIASVRWPFEAQWLERLRAQGLAFADVTLQTIEVGQARFVADSEKVQQFVRDYRAAGADRPSLIAHPRGFGM